MNLCRLGMVGPGDGAGFHNWFWLGTGVLAAQVELITAMTRLWFKFSYQLAKFQPRCWPNFNSAASDAVRMSMKTKRRGLFQNRCNLLACTTITFTAHILCTLASLYKYRYTSNKITKSTTPENKQLRNNGGPAWRRCFDVAPMLKQRCLKVVYLLGPELRNPFLLFLMQLIVIICLVHKFFSESLHFSKLFTLHMGITIQIYKHGTKIKLNKNNYSSKQTTSKQRWFFIAVTTLFRRYVGVETTLFRSCVFPGTRAP